MAAVAVAKKKKYRVLKPIDYGTKGRDETHYVAPDYYLRVHGWLTVPETVPSGSHGEPIPVNSSGIIELSDDEAAQFKHGQIAPLDKEAPPTNATGMIDREATTAKNLKKAGVEKTPAQLREEGKNQEAERAAKDE